jgi:DNA-binding response OmpR family regulator
MTTERRKPLVVVVDDDRAACRSIRYMAESYGISVDAFTSAHDLVIAIEAIPSFVPDCVILNTQLSELNGFDVLDRLRRSRPTIPVICLSDPSDSGHPRVSLTAQRIASFEKPLDLDRLAETLLDMLDASAPCQC